MPWVRKLILSEKLVSLRKKSPDEEVYLLQIDVCTLHERKNLINGHIHTLSASIGKESTFIFLIGDSVSDSVVGEREKARKIAYGKRNVKVC